MARLRYPCVGGATAPVVRDLRLGCCLPTLPTVGRLTISRLILTTPGNSEFVAFLPRGEGFAET